MSKPGSDGASHDKARRKQAKWGTTAEIVARREAPTPARNYGLIHATVLDVLSGTVKAKEALVVARLIEAGTRMANNGDIKLSQLCDDATEEHHRRCEAAEEELDAARRQLNQELQEARDAVLAAEKRAGLTAARLAELGGGG